MVRSAVAETLDFGQLVRSGGQQSEAVENVRIGFQGAAVAGVVKAVLALGADRAVGGKTGAAGVVAEVEVRVGRGCAVFLEIVGVDHCQVALNSNQQHHQQYEF